MANPPQKLYFKYSCTSKYSLRSKEGPKKRYQKYSLQPTTPFTKLYNSTTSLSSVYVVGRQTTEGTSMNRYHRRKETLKLGKQTVGRFEHMLHK